MTDALAADLLVTRIGQLATPLGPGPHRGAAQGALRIVPDAAVAVRDGRVVYAGPARDWRGEARTTVDAGGAAVVPGLVDPHTHLVWAGDRLDDFEARAAGVPYETILARGGGIRHTMRATAAADVDTLVALARPRLDALARAGATTVEIKSGYGFTPEAELRSLEAIARLGGAPGDPAVVPTLLVHVPPADRGARAAYVAHVCAVLVPEVAQRGLATAVDVFVEREAFTVAEADAILGASRACGLAVKLHADQFHAIGGVELAVRHGACSVDHLEASGPAQLAALATAASLASPTIATVLPGVSLHLGLPPAPARALVDAGAAVAVGTDCNPGSSPLASPALALALAVRLNGLTPSEALVAATANAAAALGMRDRGWLGPGARADLLVLDAADWRALPYALGGRVVARTIVAGVNGTGDDGLNDAFADEARA